MRDEPLKILHLLTHTRIRSGGAIQALLLARELSRRGHAVTFAVCERRGQADAATRGAIEQAGLAYAGLKLRGLCGFRAVRELLLRGAFDVVHLHREQALQQFLLASHFAPPIAAVANVGTSKPPSSSHARRLRSPRIDRIVVVAEALKRLLVRTAGVDPAKVEVVRGAFDEGSFRLDAAPYDRAREFGLPAQAKLIGVIANLDPKKGHRWFLEAAKLVLEQRADAYFVCAGKGDKAALHERAARAGLPQERILFLGFHRDVPRLLRTLDVSVSASTKGEGLTGAIRESLAMGTPVVSTALAGNVEIVRHRETGLLVPIRNARALADAILDVLADPAAARARAARGVAEVREVLTVARRAEQMERLYREIVEYRRVRELPVERILYPPVE